MYARQDGGDVIGRAPSILENVKTEFAVGVHVGMKHAGEKLDGWWLVRIALVECESQLERAVFERCLRYTGDRDQ